MDRTEIVEKARIFKLDTNEPEAKLFDHSRIIDLMADFALSQLTAAQKRLEIAEAALREMKDKYGPLDCSSYTRKRIMEDYLNYRQWLRDRADAALREMEGEGNSTREK